VACPSRGNRRQKEDKPLLPIGEKAPYQGGGLSGGGGWGGWVRGGRDAPMGLESPSSKGENRTSYEEEVVSKSPSWESLVAGSAAPRPPRTVWPGKRVIRLPEERGGPSLLPFSEGVITMGGGLFEGYSFPSQGSKRIAITGRKQVSGGGARFFRMVFFMKGETSRRGFWGVLRDGARTCASRPIVN